jgi:uncharacterized protein UPF0236
MSRKPDPDRQALIDHTLEKLRQQLEQKLPDDNATLDQIEAAVGQIKDEMARTLQQDLLHNRQKHARDNSLECACGGRARYKDQQVRHVVTVHGVLSIKRACYYCAGCHKMTAPLDANLGLDAGSTTTQVRLFVALLASQMPFAQAATTLQTLTKIALSSASIERISLVVGTALSQQQRREASLHQAGCLPDKKTRCPQRLYISLDGVFVPVRDAWKKDKSQGALVCRYAECKTGVVYQTKKDKTGKDSQVKTKAYVATLSDVEGFAPLLGTLAHQCGHHAAKEVVVLGDGAPWIWQLAAKQFAGAVQILDFFHACQHLAQVAEARFGKDTEEGRTWQKARQEQLKSNQLEKVLHEIAAWHPTNQEKRHLRKTTYAYFLDNAARMRYQTFLEQGYQIGSGVVEATCKHVVAQRLDQSGMHWRQESAEAIVSLRAACLSTYPPDLRPYCAMPV